MENNNGGNNKTVVILLSIVIVVLIAVIVYLFINQNPSSNDDTNPNNNEQEQVNNDEDEEDNTLREIEVTSTEVQNAMELILKKEGIKTSTSYCSFEDRLWDLASVDINSLDNDLKLQLIWENISDSDKSDNYTKDPNEPFGEYRIAESIFQDAATKVLGTSDNIPSETEEVVGCSYIITYNANDKMYRIQEVGGGDLSVASIVNSYDKAEMNNDTLIFYEKVGFVYNNSLMSTPGSDATVLVNNVTLDNVLDYKDKFTTYKYTFKKGNDGSYYFESMERKTN